MFQVHTGPRFAHGFQPSVCIRIYNKNMLFTGDVKVVFFIRKYCRPRIMSIAGDQGRHFGWLLERKECMNNDLYLMQI
jgi:hypothetical protein